MSCQNEAATTYRQNVTFLSFEMANLDETTSATAAKDLARMNSTVLGSVGGVGVKICELRQVQRFMKLTHEKYSTIKSHWWNLTVFSTSMMFDGVKDVAPPSLELLNGLGETYQDEG